MKVIKIFGSIIFWCLILFVGSFSVSTAIDQMTGYQFPFFGYRSSVIVSESMSTANEENTYLSSYTKRINKYDLITTTTYKSFEDVSIYDVATYYQKGVLICHRVVDKYVREDGVEFVVFRGDANNVNDAPVAYSDVRGKVINVVPGIGQFVLYVQSPYIWIAIFGGGFFICLGLYIYELDRDRKEIESSKIIKTMDMNTYLKLEAKKATKLKTKNIYRRAAEIQYIEPPKPIYEGLEIDRKEAKR